MVFKKELELIKRKLVAVGNVTVGKTSLVGVLGGGPFWGTKTLHRTCEWNDDVRTVQIDGRSLEIALWDAAGLEDYDRFRQLSYPESVIILNCFAVNDLDSFHAASERWYPEILHSCSKPKVPILLIGCESHLRKDFGSPLKKDALKTEIAAHDGHALAEQIGAVAYLECSSKTGAGIDEVLMKVAKVVISWDPLSRREAIRRGGCLIL